MTKEIIKQIQARNKRVEADKAWETSYTRKSIISILTYIIATLFLWLINIPYPYLNALVPTGGYFLSTLTLPPLKRWWISKIYKK